MKKMNIEHLTLIVPISNTSNISVVGQELGLKLLSINGHFLRVISEILLSRFVPHAR
jgi:hypothetical protein